MLSSRPATRLHALVLTLLIAAAPLLSAAERVPREQWMSYASPEEAGYSSDRLAEARDYWKSIGAAAVLVVVDGAVLVDWGETARRFRCHSVRKSFMSGVYGIHIDKTETSTGTRRWRSWASWTSRH